jgi:glycosyltransferase involved in cell wall biosynthesis
LYVVAVNPREFEASFIRAHIDRLPARTVAVHGFIPTIGSEPVLSSALTARLARKIVRAVRREPWNSEITLGYLRAFSERPAAVLAEYGPTAVRLVDPCRRAGIPLIAHFHGYDSSVHAVLEENREAYPKMFEAAAAVIGVSHAMCRALVRLGAAPAKVHYVPYGVDCERFRPTDPGVAAPTVLAVGRLVEKKAPYLTVLAFAEVHKRNPAARLRIAGDGPLYGPCLDLVAAMGLTDAVTFLGNQSHDAIAGEMRSARCFVQHSVQAFNGDCEGTPNSILEAGASGLPVVSTLHAGIPDVVVEGETGFLVEERDVRAMADRLERLLDNPSLAARMGRAARLHIASEFAVERRLAQLWSIIEAAIQRREMPGSAFTELERLPSED